MDESIHDHVENEETLLREFPHNDDGFHALHSNSFNCEYINGVSFNFHGSTPSRSGTQEGITPVGLNSSGPNSNTSFIGVISNPDFNP